MLLNKVSHLSEIRMLFKLAPSRSALFLIHLFDFTHGTIFIDRDSIPISSFPLKFSQANWSHTPLQREYGTD